MRRQVVACFFGAAHAPLAAYYDDMKKIAYRLFAVWVHAGGAGSGHYWAHIRDPLKAGRWIKFNDIHCSVVTQDDVFKDALGGPGITSAYFLIYMSEEEYHKNYADTDPAESSPAIQVAPIALVPAAWRKEIEEANSKLSKEVEEQTKNSTDKKMERFLTSFTSKLRAAQEIANTYTLSSDMRVRNFPAFLMSGGLREDAISFLIKEHWVVEFSRGVEKDMESSAFQLACAKLAAIGGEDVMRRAVDSAFNREREDQLKKQHAEFRAIFQIFSAGLSHLTDGRFHDALRHLAVAHRRNEALVRDQNCFILARRRDIEPMLQVCLLACHDEVMNKPAKHAKTLWKDLIDAIRWAFPGEHPFMVAFREKYFGTILGDDFGSNATHEEAEALEIIKDTGERLVGEETVVLFPITSFSDPKPFDEPEQWEQLVSRTKDAIVRCKKSEDVFVDELKTMLEMPVSALFPSDTSPPVDKVDIPGLEALSAPSTPANNNSNANQTAHVVEGPVIQNHNTSNYDVQTQPDRMDVD